MWNQVGFGGAMPCLVLYQGTTLVGPLKVRKELGLQPLRRPIQQELPFFATENQDGTTLVVIATEGISSWKG
jgi:hypothetical protein